VNGARGAEAGVVHEEVDSQSTFVNCRCETVSCRSVAQVGSEHLDADSICGAQLVGEGAQTVLPTGDERDTMTPPGKLAGKVGADARRSPCDKGRGVVWGARK
jgi:hypothetical protein